MKPPLQMQPRGAISCVPDPKHYKMETKLAHRFSGCSGEGQRRSLVEEQRKCFSRYQKLPLICPKLKSIFLFYNLRTQGKKESEHLG